VSSRFRVVVTDFVCDSMDREREILGELADVEPLDCRSEGCWARLKTPTR